MRRLLVLVQLRKLYRNLIRGQCLLELPHPVYSQAGGQFEGASTEAFCRVQIGLCNPTWGQCLLELPRTYSKQVGGRTPVMTCTVRLRKIGGHIGRAGRAARPREELRMLYAHVQTLLFRGGCPTALVPLCRGDGPGGWRTGRGC